MFRGACEACGRVGYLNDSDRGHVTMREPHIHTPAHDPCRPMGSAEWWRRNCAKKPDWWERVYSEPFDKPSMACPECGRVSDTGNLHWAYCRYAPANAEAHHAPE